MPPTSILIVEDEAIVALDLKQQLQELGYAVAGTMASGEQAIAAVEARPPQLILMDVRLQGRIDGIDAAQAIRQRHDVPVIFLTSHSDDETVKRAAHTAPYGYLTKPYQIKELRAGIEVALTKVRMERQLREADRWFAHTLRCVADGVVVTDLDKRIRFLNPAAEALTGWALEEAAGRPVGEIVQFGAASGTTQGGFQSRPQGSSPEVPPNASAPSTDAAQLVAEVLRAGRPAQVAHAVPLRARTGASRFVDETAGPVDDDAGRRMGAVLILRDATRRLAQEAELRSSEARFRSAFDFAPLGMALVSFAGEFIQVNDALCTLLGRSGDEMKSHRQAQLTHEADALHEAQRLHELAVFDSGVVQFEKRYLRAAGEPVWVLVSVSLLHDADQVACYLYQVHDLTGQKRAAEMLATLAEERLRREASELASTAKSEFLSRVSHEMRTPLNAVMGFAQLLQLQQSLSDPVTVGRYAHQIHAAGEHLLALVTDLLDLNRAAQGRLKLEVSPVPLARVVHEALDLLEGQAEAHGIQLDAQIDLQLQVLADERRLRQVLLNLCSNAIKYNHEGGFLRLRASRAGAGAGAGADTGAGADAMVALSIQDRGIGMTPAQLERLFQPFNRLGAERTKIPGTGLGLVIARGLVAEMGGSLTIESNVREGTTATLRLHEAVATAA